jgi:hypothetical protein
MDCSRAVIFFWREPRERVALLVPVGRYMKGQQLPQRVLPRLKAEGLIDFVRVGQLEGVPLGRAGPTRLQLERMRANPKSSTPRA